MKSTFEKILISGTNPFDRSYYYTQSVFDHRIIHLLTEIMLLNVTVIKNPLITNFTIYDKDPDYWILEQIVNGSAEMSLSTIILTPESKSVVSYSFGIDTFKYSIILNLNRTILKQTWSLLSLPGNLEFFTGTIVPNCIPQLYYKATSLRESFNIYLKPFSPKLWACLVAAAVLLTLGLIFILSREVKLPHEISYDVLARIIDVQQARDDDEAPEDIQNTPKEVLLQKEKWEMGEILLICLGALCQQGSARDPSTNAARLLILVLFVLAVVGFTAYSASVISLVSHFSSTDYAQCHDMKCCSRKFNTFLYNANHVKHLPLDFIEVEHTSLKKGLDKALKGEAVFGGDMATSLTFLHKQNYSANVRCKLAQTSLGIDYHRVFAVNSKSKYKHKINYNILRLKQFGLLFREKRRIFNVEPPCTLKERLSISNFVSFSKEDILPVLNFFKLGIVISLLLLILENLVFLCPNLMKTFWEKAETKNLNLKNIPITIEPCSPKQSFITKKYFFKRKSENIENRK